MKFPYLINVKHCLEVSPPKRMRGIVRLAIAFGDIRDDMDVPMILENLIYTKATQLVDIYSNNIDADIDFHYNHIIYVLCSHLDKTSPVFHSEIYQKINSKSMTMEEVCNLDNANFNESNRNKIRHMFELRMNSSAENSLKSESILYKCSKCKSRNCDVRATQTRALDESSGVRVSCKDCGTVKNISY